MPLTEVQRARNVVGGKIRAGAKPEEIERARGLLQFTKAQLAITSWTSLTTTQRAELAKLLLAGNGQ